MGALSALRALKPGTWKRNFSFIDEWQEAGGGQGRGASQGNSSSQRQKLLDCQYEALVFNNVVYRRKGRLFMWITDDADRIPVQFRMQMGFPVGTVTLELEKHERL